MLWPHMPIIFRHNYDVVKYNKISKTMRQWPWYFGLKEYPMPHPQGCAMRWLLYLGENWPCIMSELTFYYVEGSPTKYIVLYHIISYCIINISQHIKCYMTSHRMPFSTEIDLLYSCCCIVLGWGLLYKFPPFHYFLSFPELWKCPLNITFIFGRCHHSSSVKYECE